MILSDCNFYFFKGDNKRNIQNQVLIGLSQMYDNVINFNITI